MNQHPTIGAEIVAPASQLAAEAPLIKAHHEWFNGSGYPDGVEALDIPLGARILTIADAYEAMTSSRPYRKVAAHPRDGRRPAREVRRHPVRPRDRARSWSTSTASILDRPPDRPDELPTMLQRPGHQDAPPPETSAHQQEPTTRPALASDDVS